ncbi:MAG: hypothetical protein PHI63_02645 [Patescibacteria group bacterium]|nr:hypothetical protein [Patescibacteria group bacterium]
MPAWRARNTLFWIITMAFAVSAATAVTAAVVVVPTALRDSGFVALLIPAATGTPTVPVSSPLATADWLIYRSQDLTGINFKYPQTSGQYLPSGGTSSAWFGSAEWKMADAELLENHQTTPYDQIFKMIAATPGKSAHESCCGFSGPTIDLAQTDEQLAMEIAAHMGPVTHFQRLTVGNRPAVAFVHGERSEQGGSMTLWVTRSYLLPYARESYTNLLISGPALAVKVVPTDAAAIAAGTSQLLGQVTGDWQPPDSDIQRRLKIFETMVQTIVFTAP